MTSLPDIDEERARNRWAARRATAAAGAAVGVAEMQALSNAIAEGVAHRRASEHRAIARAGSSPDRASAPSE